MQDAEHDLMWLTCPKCGSQQVIVDSMCLVERGGDALRPVDTWEIKRLCKACGHSWKEREQVPDTTGEY